MIKRILWFIGLKIGELAALFLVVMSPHWLGKLIHHWTGFFCDHDAAEPFCQPMWLIGMGSLAGLSLVCFVVFLAILCIAQNWKWAGELNWKFRKKGE